EDGLREVREPGLRDDVVRERLADEPGAVWIGLRRGRVVNGELVAVLIDPVAEVPLVHLGRRHAEEVARGADPVAEPFHGAEEKRLLTAVVELRQDDRASHAPAEALRRPSEDVFLQRDRKSTRLNSSHDQISY